MTRISWDDDGKRFFEFGVDRGVIFPRGATPIPWNGLTAVKEAPTDSESAAFYQDGKKYRNGVTRGSFAGSIDALSYPEEFEDYRGSFGLSYRTKIGNDLDESSGYKLHLVYNAQAKPLLANYLTINQSVSPTIFSWSLSTKPAFFPRGIPSAHLVIDSRLVYSGVMDEFEDLLYGVELTDGIFPTPQQVIDFFDERALLQITDNGDGSWTAVGPDEAIQMLDADTFEITWPSAIYIDAESYVISTW